MKTIGVRELKEQTSGILRRVREQGESFEVTYHGRVVARLVPVTQPRSEIALSAFWDRWSRLSDAVSAQWPADVSAVDAIRDERREL